MSKLYTVKEIAKKAKVSEGHIYELVKRGEIIKADSLGRVIRIPSSELQRIKNRHEREYFMYNSEKVEVVETSLGKIRKVKSTDAYVLVDIARAIGLNDSYVVAKAIGNECITKLKTEDLKGLGLFSNQFGILLINKDGIKQYSSKSRNKSNVDKLIQELKIDTCEQEVQQTFDETIRINEISKGTNKELQIFEGHAVEIIDLNGEVLFELYSTGMALGHIKKVTNNGQTYMYPRKERIEENVSSADIKPVVHNGQKYLTEPMLYDLMLEMKTEKVKPFKKWVTSEVLPAIRKTGGYVAKNREEEFIDNYFSNFSDEVRRVMLSDLQLKNRQLRYEIENNDKLIDMIEITFN